MDHSKLTTAPAYAAPADWLGPALDDTLQAVREALSRFRSGEDGPLRAAASDLHQLSGILTIAQWHGAALVAGELEATLEALAEGAVDDAEAVMTSLAQGLTVLENYLRHLEAGHEDQPMALLPTLNELRAGRRAQLLSAGLLLRLEVAAAAPPPPSPDSVQGSALPAVLGRLHGYYQSALLAWYRDGGDRRALGQLDAVLGCLLDTDCGTANRRLWWIAGGATEALAQGTLERGLPLRRLLGQVERHLHALARAAEPQRLAPPAALLKDLLYYIAQAAPASPRVQALHEAYQLARAVPSSTYLSALSEAIGAPERQAYAVLAQGLLEDLQILKARIDHDARHPMDLDRHLDDTLARLASLGDSLTLLGLGAQRELLQSALAALEKAPRAALEDLALALVHVEAALTELAHGRPQGEPEEADGAEGEYRQGLRAALREAGQSLEQVRSGILAFVSTGSRERGLGEVPGQLAELRGVLVLLGHDRIARLVDGLRRHIAYDLLDAETPPKSLALDLLAEALVALEGYLEAVARGDDGLTPFIHTIARCLAALGHPVEPALADHEAPIPTLDQPVRAAPPRPTVIPLPVDEVDEDVVAIFIDEAGEVGEALARAAAALAPGRPDRPLLERLRHGFHTLKGSGRIAGALELSDFAHALEDLVGRIIHGAQPWNEDALRFLRTAVERVPALVDAFAGQRPAPEDVPRLMAAARAGDLAPAEDHPQGMPATTPWAGPDAPDTAAPPPPTQTPVAADPEPPAPETDRLPPLPETPAPSEPPAASDAQATGADAPPATAAADPEPAPIPPPPETDRLPPLPEAPAAPDAEAARMDAPEAPGPEHAFEDDRPAPGEAEGLARRFAAVETAATALALLDELAEYGRRRQAMHLVDFALRARALAEEQPHALPALLAAEVPPRLSPLAPPPAWEALGARLIALTRTPPEEKTPPPPVTDSEGADPALVAIFLEEAAELMEALEATLPRWPLDQAPAAEEVHAVQRNLHTLKGGARMAGLMDLGETAHALETVMERLADGQLAWTAGLRDAVQQTLDHLSEALEQVTQGQPPASGKALRQRLRVGSDAQTPRPQDEATESEPQDPKGSDREIMSVSASQTQERPTPAEPAEALRSETLRIGADTVDDLVNQAKEDGLLNIRAGEQQTLLKSHLDELGKAIDRLRGQIRGLPAALPALPDEPGADPGQALLETVEDLASLHQTLHQINMESGRILGQQNTVQRRLQNGLIEARMIPFARQLPRLQRLVRQVAGELGREARVELVGASGRLDRVTLERLAGPIEHLLRNALAHGIEPPEARLQAGKPPIGTIRLGLAREGDDQVITVSDDGRGIDPQAVAAAARRRGLPVPEPLTPEGLLEILTRPGFSTAGEVNAVAGRGIGLDAVAAQVRDLGGRLSLDTRPGRGTTFTLRIPFTLGMNRCVLVAAGDNVYALPAQHVAHIVQVSREELARLRQQPEPSVRHQGEDYRFVHLAVLLRLPQGHPPRPAHLTPLILLRHEGRRLALLADRLLGSRELVLKGDGAPLASTHEGVLGATVLGDGRVALVLDVPGLLARPLPEAPPAPAQATPAAPGEGPVKVLVVDDSITVRKVTERLLTRHHMQVRTARDGLEALERLEEETPDVVLLDIEMPRMDGFELAERLRSSERWRDLPIIMISSRSGPRQRSRALQLGVDRFLSKPYQEAMLVAQIEALTQRAETVD